MHKTSQNNESKGTEDAKIRYHIPKRKADQLSANTDIKAPTETLLQNIVQTPLANSYYNYPYDVSAASSYYGSLNGNYTQFYTQYGGVAAACSFGVTPPPPPPGTPVVDPIKQDIYKALKDIKEKPKNYKQNIFESTVPDIMDESLPKDLKMLFQPLFCKLCTAQLSSNQTAKMHYKSKNHEKKIKKWLLDYSQTTGEPLHKRAKITNEKQTEEAERNPAWFHCEVCDLQLTGKLHAQSHYMGRNHQKALLGYKPPAGQGYYDTTGKWVRINHVKSKSYDFQNGEDNIGLDFKPIKIEQALLEPTITKKKEVRSSSFHCDLCNINTTCQEQLDNHFRGKKHFKELSKLGVSSEQKGTSELPGCATPILTEKELNLSVYRTPSGDYYCPTCNITSNSEGQFIQHWKSKNHAKKATQKRSGN